MTRSQAGQRVRAEGTASTDVLLGCSAAMTKYVTQAAYTTEKYFLTILEAIGPRQGASRLVSLEACPWLADGHRDLM